MLILTDKQIERFVYHIADSHSWYKHLSLIWGGQFIITTDENSGIHYPTMHPKLVFGNSMTNYKKAFGDQIFFWKNHDEKHFQTDGELTDYTEEEIELKYPRREKINIFPYVSNDFIEAINFRKDDFDRLINLEHEQKTRLLSIFETHATMDSIWQTVLTNEERNHISTNDDFLTKNGELYLSIENNLQSQLIQLRNIELNKIKTAIENLKA